MQAAHIVDFSRHLSRRPPRGTVQGCYLRGFQSCVTSRGGDYRSILERHNIDPNDVARPDSSISCRSLLDIWEYCSREYNDPLFGYKLASQQNCDALGMVTALARAAPSVDEALRCYVDYVPVTCSREGMLIVTKSNKTIELSWETLDSDFQLSEQAQLHGLKLFSKVLEMILGPSSNLNYVAINFDIGSQSQRLLESDLKCKMMTGQKSSLIAFDQDLLKLPVETADPMLFRVLDDYLGALKRSWEGSIIDQVESYISSSLSSFNCSIERCASYIGKPVRTLQNHLAEKGTKFSSLLASQRLRIAKSELMNKSISIDDIGYRLGYCEQTAFGRAFKGWTGMTPSEYRRMAVYSVRDQ